MMKLTVSFYNKVVYPDLDITFVGREQDIQYQPPRQSPSPTHQVVQDIYHLFFAACWVQVSMTFGVV